jgi:hypothetical protein
MMRIEDFLIASDKFYKDPFEYMKENEMIKESVKVRSNMNDDEIKSYIKEREKMISNYQKKWLKILSSSCL